MYRIEYSKDIEKDLAKLPKSEVEKILKKISSLSQEPRPSGLKLLKGNLKGLYRIRSGDYRIIYQIKDDRLIILILRIAHRRNVYE